MKPFMPPSILEPCPRPLRRSSPRRHKEAMTQGVCSLSVEDMRTTGQHSPVEGYLYGYSAFPSTISGPTVWSKEEHQDQPERWRHCLTQDEQEELSNAADNYATSGRPLTGICKETFLLPILAKFLAHVRAELLNGKGFVLLKDLPTERLGLQKSAVAYMGIGVHLGYLVSQNGQGHILSQVKHLDDTTATEKNLFHTDESDITGFLCGEPNSDIDGLDIVSAHNLYNTMEKEHPDVLRILMQPIWHFDCKDWTSPGERKWIRGSVIYLERMTLSNLEGTLMRAPRVYWKWNVARVESLAQYSAGPDAALPSLSSEQMKAMEVLESTCKRLAMRVSLQVGDVLFLSNSHILHSFSCNATPRASRTSHLSRLWLATPESQGGWRLPFVDSDYSRRGGIQAGEQEPTVPLELE